MTPPGSPTPTLQSKAAPLPVRIITPHSGLEGLRDAAVGLVESFPAAVRLAWRFFLRDTRAEHRQSLLGFFWLVVPALANTLVWVFLNGANVISIDSRDVPYPLFVLAGTILWAAFNGAVMSVLGVIPAARGLLSKVNFPHESLVYAACIKSATDATIAAFLLIPAVLIFGTTSGTEILLFPAALLGSLMLGWAIGLLAVPSSALYADISRAIQLALRFGFFLTPVIFGLPDAQPARTLLLLNPVTPIVVTGRSWLTGSPDAMPGPFFLIFAAAAAIFTLGLVVYKVALPHLIERLSG